MDTTCPGRGASLLSRYVQSGSGAQPPAARGGSSPGACPRSGRRGPAALRAWATCSCTSASRHPVALRPAASQTGRLRRWRRTRIAPGRAPRHAGERRHAAAHDPVERRRVLAAAGHRGRRLGGAASRFRRPLADETAAEGSLRGQRYGTIICDLEQHRVIDLLPDRSADTLASQLKRHGGEVTIVSRGRSGAYADGIRAAAPRATQVAKR